MSAALPRSSLEALHTNVSEGVSPMAVQTRTATAEVVTGAAPMSAPRLLQAAAPLVMLLAAGAAGLGAASVIGTGARHTPAPVVRVTPGVSGPLPVVGPNVREGRVSPASSCPPLLDGHPSHRVVRTWVCPRP